MFRKREIINLKNYVPFSISLAEFGSTESWTQCATMLLILDGAAAVMAGAKQAELKHGDIFMIDANSSYSLYGKSCCALMVEIDIDNFGRLPAGYKNLGFRLSSEGQSNKSAYSQLKTLIADILKTGIEGDVYLTAKLISKAYGFLYFICENFAYVKDDNPKKEQEYALMTSILLYLNSNFSSKISLESIADKFGFTPQYFSKFFKHKTGKNFHAYLSDLRLEHALEDMLTTDAKLDSIAYKNGFPNPRTFSSAFRQTYGYLPNDYRKKHSLIKLDHFLHKVSLEDIDNPSAITSLTSFIGTYMTPGTQRIQNEVSDVQITEKTVSITLDSFTAGKRFNNLAKGIIGISAADELLTQKNRDAVIQAVKDIKFEYIKLADIFDDRLNVYSEINGKPQYNFSELDEIIDFCLNLNLKPILQFSYMPKDLAKPGYRQILKRGFLIGEPKSMASWSALIKALLRHLRNRYGISIESWLFSLWNNPALENDQFGFANSKFFTGFWQTTYRAVKNFDSKLKMIGPNGFATNGMNRHWLFEFLYFAKKSNCFPDIITINYYDLDLKEIFAHHDELGNLVFLSNDPDSPAKFTQLMRKTLDNSGMDDTPVWLSEFNSTVRNDDYLNDTCFKSTYLAHNLSAMAGSVQRICYWMLTDSSQESQLPSRPFFGGAGLIDSHNIPKAAYWAVSLMSKMPNCLLEKGNGYIVCSDGTDKNISILLNNYTLFSSAYGKEIGVNTTYTQRYSVFPDKKNRRFSLDLNLDEGEWIIKTETVSQDRGSAYDEWAKMGYPQSLTPEDISYLKSVSVPARTCERITKGRKNYLRDEILPPFSLRLITFKKLTD